MLLPMRHSSASSTVPATAGTSPSSRPPPRSSGTCLKSTWSGPSPSAAKSPDEWFPREAAASVHIASVSGLIGNKGRSAYGATKAALVNLTQVMSNELARHNIRVNCVCPGPIETPLAAAAHGGAGKAAWEKAVPMKRYGSPEEVASAVGFLLQEEASSYVTGQVLSVEVGSSGLGSCPNRTAAQNVNHHVMRNQNLCEPVHLSDVVDRGVLEPAQRDVLRIRL